MAKGFENPLAILGVVPSTIIKFSGVLDLHWHAIYYLSLLAAKQQSTQQTDEWVIRVIKVIKDARFKG
jgi:hypothetical protein